MRKLFLAVVLIADLTFAAADADVRQQSAASPTSTELSVSLTSPRPNGTIECSRHSDGLYRCSVSGVARLGARDDVQLLLWMKPLRPAGDGWYLQRGKVNGIQGVARGGTWNALAQLGNAEWPPAEGHVVAVAVTIAPRADAMKLLSAEGVVVRSAPAGDHTDEATNVTVHLR